MVSMSFLLMVLIGCKSLPPAPTELDELIHFFFLEYDNEDEEYLLSGIDNLLEWQSENGAADGTSGEVSDVSPDELTAIEMDPNADLTWLTGIFELIPHRGCTPQDMGHIYLFDDQPSLFPGEYESYGREYHLDPECFYDASCPDASWSLTVTDTLFGRQITYTYMVQMRQIPMGNDSVVLSRTWMQQPAEIGDDADALTFFDQSYQIEAFAPYEDGDNLHLSGLWISGGIEGLDPEADIWSHQFLDGLQTWGARLDELCNEDRQLWDGAQ